MAYPKLKAEHKQRFYRTSRGQKAALKGASSMCMHIRRQFSARKPLSADIQLFDATVPGEFAMCSLCARFFVMAGPEESAKLLRTARVDTKKRRRKLVNSIPPPLYSLMS
jgi:hypothetical protein